VVVARMSKELPRWMMRDPAQVAEQLEEMARKRAAKTRSGRSDKAREELEKLFKEKPSEAKP